MARDGTPPAATTPQRMPAHLLGLSKGTRIAPGYRTTVAGGERTMKNPLDSLWGTVICGLVLTLILYNIVRFAMQ
jgi:hypothetical protein